MHPVRSHAAHEIFFHIDDPGRHATAIKRAGLPGSMVPAVASSPRARAPTTVALSRMVAAGTSGASARNAASSANRFRSSLLARLSVPTATATPDR